MCSTMWTGIRIVRAWSAIDRGDRLADPPRRVRGELEALGVVELVDRPHQPEVALLDQVEQLHAPARIPLGDADDQSQVGLRQFALGPLAALHRSQQFSLVAFRCAGVDLLGSRVTRLDQLRQTALVLGGEQIDLPDLTEVQPNRVGGATVDPQRTLLSAAPATTRQQPLDVVVLPGVLVAFGARGRRVVDVLVMNGLVDLDAGRSQHLVHRLQRVAREFDLAQHVSDRLGVQHAGSVTASDQGIPFRSVHTDERCRYRRHVDWFKPHRHVPLCVLPANLATIRPPQGLVRRY